MSDPTIELKFTCPSCNYSAQVSGERYYELEWQFHIGTRACKSCHRLFDNVVTKLGIKKGSDLDHAVVEFGEGKIRLEELQNDFPNDWQKVVKADEWFRNKYPQLLQDLNAVREANFPTHPLYPESSKIIPQRKDYYRHGTDLEGFSGLRNMFEGSASIDPALAITSDVTNPKTKWLSFAQKRKSDANFSGALF